MYQLLQNMLWTHSIARPVASAAKARLLFGLLSFTRSALDEGLSALAWAFNAVNMIKPESGSHVMDWWWDG